MWNQCASSEAAMIRKLGGSRDTAFVERTAWVAGRRSRQAGAVDARSGTGRLWIATSWTVLVLAALA